MIRIVWLPEVSATAGEATEIGADDRRAIAGSVITIGNFDGVHLGHAHLLGEVRRRADQAGCPAVAVVLDPHPASILRPDKAPTRLTWIHRRAERMDQIGIDALVVCNTTPELLQMTADQFFEWLVVNQVGARGMVEGPNFFFGRNRGGDVTVLGQLCRTHQIQLQIVSPTLVGGQMISSTRIRNHLQSGQVEQAAELLGAPHRIRGQVVSGARRGGTIGFPTANLSSLDVVVPAHGVYGGMATIASATSGSLAGDSPCATYQAAIHIGPNPTFENGGEEKVEVHLLDFDGDLYDQTLLVDFAFKVRDITRFDSADNLIEQLKRDIATIRDQLS